MFSILNAGNITQAGEIAKIKAAQFSWCAYLFEHEYIPIIGLHLSEKHRMLG